EAQLDQEANTSVRRALILALGGFGPDRLPPAARGRLVPRLARLYAEDADPGVHAASEWLLRRWRRPDQLRVSGPGPAAARVAGSRGWDGNRENQTLTIVRGPVESRLGEGEGRRRRVEHSFAIAAKEVTVAEFLRFKEDHPYNKEVARTPDCPVNSVSFFL